MAVNPIINLRVGGSPLTNSQLDSNFVELKNAAISVGNQVDDVEVLLNSTISDQATINSDVDSMLNSHETSITTLTSTVNNVSSDYIKRDGSLSFTGNLDAGGFSIINIPTPSSADSVVNKDYVDLSISSAVAGLNLASYLKIDGSNGPTANIDLNGFNFTGLALPVNGSDAASMDFVNSRVAFLNETKFSIADSDITSSDVIPSTYAYEIDNNELLDNLIFSSNVDSDSLTFPNRSYVAKIRFADVYANFPNGIVDVKIVNKSTGKLMLNVYLNDGTPLCRIPPQSQIRLQWKGDQIDPVWLMTKSSNLESLEINKPADKFVKSVVVFDSSGAMKVNHVWIGQCVSAGLAAIEFSVNHVAGSGIYDISWINRNGFSDDLIHSPVVIPTLLLTSADTGDYRIYVKDLTGSGCSIHIKEDGVGYVDKEFSIMLGGHNSPSGNSYGNPFLV